MSGNWAVEFSDLGEALVKAMEEPLVRLMNKHIGAAVPMLVDAALMRSRSPAEGVTDKSVPALIGDLEAAILKYPFHAVCGRPGRLTSEPHGGMDLSHLARYLAEELKKLGWAKITPKSTTSS